MTVKASGVAGMATIFSAVRRQSFWVQGRLKLREYLAHLVGFIMMRHVVCDASAGPRRSFV